MELCKECSKRIGRGTDVAKWTHIRNHFKVRAGASGDIETLDRLARLGKEATKFMRARGR